MTKQELIKAICESKDYRFTHDELMRMTKKELVEVCNPVTDLQAVVERAGNPGYEPREEDIIYFLATFADGNIEIQKMVVTNRLKKDADSPIEQIRGYKYGEPNCNIIIKLPFLTFKSREALCEYYRKIFE